jgi:acetyl-CoA synthetase (ADP-forming)
VSTPASHTARAILAAARAAGRAALSEVEAKRVLAAFGIAVPNGRLLPPAPAAGFADGLSPPFALKIVSRDILHKTEVGGVRLRLANEAEVADAIAAMGGAIAAAGHRVEGWLLEEMAPAGIEMVIGGLRDHRFGPVVMTGFGGVLIELLEDIAFAICPVDATDCDDMLATLRGRAMLDGWRGTPPAATGALREVLLRVGGAGGLLESLGAEIAELDINPLIVSPAGAVAADARILLGGVG